MLAVFVLAVAAKAGAPVHRIVPAPVKVVYANVAEWRSDQDAAAQCISGRTKALRSGSQQHFVEAERRCAKAAARRAR